MLDEIPIPPVKTFPAPPAPPPAPAAQLAELQPDPLVPPNPPALPFPLAPPYAPRLLVNVLVGVFPPPAVIVPKFEYVPSLIAVPPATPLVPNASPPPPTLIAIDWPGVVEKLEFEVTPPPPPPAGQ